MALVQHQIPPGWHVEGSYPHEYEIGIDYETKHNGSRSAYLKSIVDVTHGFCTLLQSFSSKRYRGKRLRLSAVIKVFDIKERAGLLLRVNGWEVGRVLSFDDMESRPIKGTSDWKSYECVLDVDANSYKIDFGVLISGKGQMWLDDVLLEVVDNTVPITNALKDIERDEPINLNFEMPLN